MPLQHIHENMLERMRRETSQQYIVDLIQRIRAGVPGIALRTTFIVGFPGETEASFNTLLDFIRETKFEQIGRASCKGKSVDLGGRRIIKKKKQNTKKRTRLRSQRRLTCSARRAAAQC